MSLPESWVDRIFSKLTVAYGRRFMDLYAGLEMDAVKADWADELAGFQQSPDSIRHGLEHLPSDNPPNVFQFRDLCRKAPLVLPKALPAPPVNPEVVKAVKAGFRPVSAVGDREWAAKLQARIDAKELRPTMFQRDALAEVLGVAP